MSKSIIHANSVRPPCVINVFTMSLFITSSCLLFKLFIYKAKNQNDMFFKEMHLCQNQYTDIRQVKQKCAVATSADNWGLKEQRTESVKG